MTSKLAEPCRPEPLAWTPDEMRRFGRVVTDRRAANKDCCRELYFGFFFDGTNNNADLRRTSDPNKQDEQGLSDRHAHAHSNVARLFDVFPDNRKAKEYFARYAPGVGTPFPDIGDEGRGDDIFYGETSRRRGLALGQMGEARVVWGLLQALNNVHQYFLDNNRLLDPADIKKLSKSLTTAPPPAWQWITEPGVALRKTLIEDRADITRRRQEVLAQWCDKLRTTVAPYLLKKPEVKRIRVSVFGFSRGAAQARAFTTWFTEMCTAAGQGQMALGGIPVELDFVGIFDTVASIGLAHSALITDGHMAWADAEHTLRIPAEVKRCVHLVSAHEVRRSFPLDSIRVGGAYTSSQHLEVVYPGVHSDVGGGYRPQEQGRGLDPKGSDMISRIPLAEMYREARLAGVPLDVDAADKGVTPQAKQALSVAPVVRQAFNEYVAACQVKKAPLEAIFDEQTAMQVRWRRARLDHMAKLPSVLRAAPQDRIDILAANEELRQEVALLEAPLELRINPVLAANGVVLVADFVVRAAKEYVSKRGVDKRHHDDWRKLKPHWQDNRCPPPCLTLFDEYIHDSRAWFKPMADEEHVWRRQQQQRWDALEARDQRTRAFEAQYKQGSWLDKALMNVGRGQAAQSPVAAPAAALPLSPAEQKALADFRQHGLPPQRDGRELFTLGAGYMRYRRIYHGHDELFVAGGYSQSEYQQVAGRCKNARAC